MLDARSVAVVGASPRPDSFGQRMVIEALRGSARVHLVNPRHGRIGEIPCAPSLEHLDEAPDLVLLGVPDSAVVEQLAAAARLGSRSAVLFGSAFGAARREAIAQIAGDAGMALCGAGCMGFVNNASGVRALGYLEPHPLPTGGISVVTHSGSAFSTLLRSRRGFGFRLAVSSGQELVTDTADYVGHTLDDPQTRVIGLLMETPRRSARLAEALHRAADQGVPVIILTVGGSPRGRSMVAAHSGALAGDAAGWAAFCAATGAVRTTDMSEFTDTLELFGAGRRSCGGRIATVHDSGAERALCADIAHELGIEFAALSPATLTALNGHLDDGLEATNPLDVWGTGADTRDLFRSCLRTIAADRAVAVTALAVDLVTEYDGDTSYADAILDVAAATGAPLAVLTSEPAAVDQKAVKLLRDNHIAVLEGMRSGLAALGHLAAWPLPRQAAAGPVDQDRQHRWRDRLRTGSVRPFELLADYGIPIVASRRAGSEPEVVAAAQAVGFPVALKTTGAEHKTDVGGVVLGLADEGALRAAYAEMSAALGPRVSVDAMADAGVEISVGVINDPAFGPLLVVAAGGVTVELLGDRAVAQPPVDEAAAGRLLDRLRIAPLLHGWRGAAPVDVGSLQRVIAGFSQLATELGDMLGAVEANPVIVSPGGAVAVDVLVIARDQKIE